MLKTCRNCGKEFKVKPSHYDKKAYCSQDCMTEDYRTRYKGEANPNYRNAAEKVCANCGKSFFSYRKTTRYCSVKCAHTTPEYRQQVSERRRRNAELKRQQNVEPLPRKKRKRSKKKDMPMEQVAKKAVQSRLPFSHWQVYCPPKTKPRKLQCPICKAFFSTSRPMRRFCKQCSYITVYCIVCEKPFTCHRSSVKRTCSASCSRRWQSIRQHGENSHFWEGGKQSKTDLFRNCLDYTLWREAVYKRDDYTCQLCSKKGGRLCAHHIKRFAIHRELALIVENGITLCWDCHASIRHKEELFEEHFYAITQQRKEVYMSEERPSMADLWKSVYKGKIEALLEDNPSLSTMDIVRLVGCSYNTANKWKRHFQTTENSKVEA